MKILLVSSSFFPKIDGSTRCIYDHARKLVERGHVVYLVTRAVNLKQIGSFGTNKYEEFEGIKIFRSATAIRSSTRLSLGKFRLALEQIFIILSLQRRIRFDVIHVHGYSACYAALPCKFIFGLPLVITTHGTELLWPRSVWWKSTAEVMVGLLFEKIALNFCDIIIAQSPGVRHYMLKIYGKSIDKKITIIHTGVDHEKFKAPPKSSGEIQILFVGALSEVKGVNCLLRAFRRIHMESPNTRLVLAGSGPRAERYREAAKEMKLNGSVNFLGAVRSDERLLELYGSSDIVVLPSNVGGPISCTILEGLSCGRAVISTNVPGGIPDVLRKGVGILIEREDEDSLVSEIRKLIFDEEHMNQLQSNARKEVVDRYTLDSMIDKLTALYQRLSG